MMHFTPRAVRGTLLFRTWSEARGLWEALTSRLPRLEALVLMPDHVHLLAEGDVAEALSIGMRAYAFHRNRLRGEAGSVWARESYARPVADARHARRTERYIYLNPVRAGLVDDPLAWPFSSLRDALGLAVAPVRAEVRRPAGLLDYVAHDLDGGLSGSRMPEAPPGARPSAALVLRAVSSLTRTPVPALGRRGPTRDLWIASLRVLAGLPTGRAAALVGVSARTARRVPARLDREVARVGRVCGDRRFSALEAGDLRGLWPGYAGRR